MTDIQVITFSDNKVRPWCDTTMRLYYASLKFVQDYDSQGIAAKIAADGASVVLTMASNDGRPPITGQDIINIYTGCKQFIAYMEGGAVGSLDRRPYVDKPSVNSALA